MKVCETIVFLPDFRSEVDIAVKVVVCDIFNMGVYKNDGMASNSAGYSGVNLYMSIVSLLVINSQKQTKLFYRILSLKKIISIKISHLTKYFSFQTSLLSSLPILLDQSHLTDVTISAEGKTLKAHRVVLSACSSFFSELFRTLDSTNHPVIVIPGNSFNAMVALLTFMYSGEVNVYEGQIPTLLSLAETLGIKGLADFQNNVISAF